MKRQITLLSVLVILAAGCAKKSPATNNTSSSDADSTAYIAESVSGVVAKTAEAGENGSSLAVLSSFSGASIAASSHCPNSLNPTIKCGGAQSNVSEIDYNSCSFDGFTLYGIQNLTFDSAASCSTYNP